MRVRLFGVRGAAVNMDAAILAESGAIKAKRDAAQ